MLLCYPATRPVRSTAPEFTQEPITLAEARAQCRLSPDFHADDFQLKELIVAAREQVEYDTGIVCYTGTYTLKKTAWAAAGRDWFAIDVRPVTAITSIVYVDTSGTSTTWSSSEYSLDTASLPAAVKLNYGYTWPALRGDIHGITVTFTAGYASVAVIPQRIKELVKLHVHYYWLLSSGVNEPHIMTAYDRLVESVGRKVYA